MDGFIRTSNQLKDVFYVRDRELLYTGDAAELAVLMSLHTGRREDSEVERFIEKRFGWGDGGTDE